MFNLRRQFLLDPNINFLNHGSFGACPRPVFQSYQRWQRELERQPVEFLGRRHNGLLAGARLALGKYLGTGPDNLVYTTNVTVALNIVARSLTYSSSQWAGLGPGDEVLSTDHEYGAIDRAWRFLAGQCGFKYMNQPIPLPVTTPEAFIEALWKGVTLHTRLIFLSHITSPTAILFPLEEIIRRARAKGIMTIIDGAHAPGQIPLRLDELGADFYGGNLHKWLCAPKGAGFLYARPELQPLLKPLVVSWGYQAEVPGPSQFVDHHEWWGTRDIAAFLAVPEAIRFQEQHDWSRVRLACHALAGQAQQRICELTGLTSLYPSFPGNGNGTVRWEGYAQFAAAPLPDSVDIPKLKARLYDEYRIEIPLIRWNGRNLIRISIQGYNTRRDVDALVDALKKLL